MKKAVWLFLAVIVCVSCFLLLNDQKESAVKVKTTVLYAKEVSETVTCRGKIEKTGQKSVKANTACVVETLAVKEGDYVKAGDVLFTIDKTATLQVMAQYDGSQAVYTAMQDTLQDEILAPCAGVVGDLDVSVGDFLEKDDVCMQLSDASSVQVRLAIPEHHIRRVNVGQSALITGEGFIESSYRGTVVEIADTAKVLQNGSTAETMVEAVVSLDRGVEDDSLRVGLNSTVQIAVTQPKTGYILPYESVEADDTAEYVYILQDGKAVRRSLDVVAETADGYLVATGFSDGDELILEPQKVQDGTVCNNV